MAIITQKGQVTIPKNVRDALGLVPGSNVEFVVEDGRAFLRKCIPDAVFDRWQGYLANKLPLDSVDEMMEALRGERLPAAGEPP
jgi:AbrB family looped-hinge helix DNA binding protein